MEDKKWYVATTSSGHENKVKQRLEMRTETMNMKKNIFRVIVPEVKEVEIKDGVEKEYIRKLFPGYILVEMIMSDDAWFVIRNTEGVTGFLGSSGKGTKPIPLSKQELDKIFRNMGMSKVVNDEKLVKGTKIIVLAEPFKDMEGVIESVNLKEKKVTANIDLFGQETSVELDMADITIL